MGHGRDKGTCNRFLGKPLGLGVVGSAVVSADAIPGSIYHDYSLACQRYLINGCCLDFPPLTAVQDVGCLVSLRSHKTIAETNPSQHVINTPCFQSLDQNRSDVTSLSSLSSMLRQSRLIFVELMQCNEIRDNGQLKDRETS